MSYKQHYSRFLEGLGLWYRRFEGSDNVLMRYGPVPRAAA